MLNSNLTYHRKNRVIVIVSHYYSPESSEIFSLKLREGYSLRWIVPKMKDEGKIFEGLEEFIAGM